MELLPIVGSVVCRGVKGQSSAVTSWKNSLNGGVREYGNNNPPPEGKDAATFQLFPGRLLGFQR